MAYYAFLDKFNIVTEVIVGVDENNLIEGLDTEIWYGNFRNQKCVRTSFNASTNGFRKNYASIGYLYSSELDAFIPPKCHDDAVLEIEKCIWICQNEDHNAKTLVI